MTKDELIIYRLNTTELLKSLVSAIPHCQAQTETVQSPGIIWQSISILFLDGQNVHVTCTVNQAAASAYEFSQFNMTDKRKKADDGGAMPNKAWAMLIKFSENHGKILLKRDDAQTKKSLKERLQDFFGHQIPA